MIKNLLLKKNIGMNNEEYQNIIMEEERMNKKNQQNIIEEINQEKKTNIEDNQNIKEEINQEENIIKEDFQNIPNNVNSNKNINDILIINEEKEKEKDNNDKDLVFNRLRNLQALLKKESSLRELFNQTSNETKKNIEDQCREIYKKKLDVFLHLRKLNHNNKEKRIKKFELIDKISENLKDLSNYIPKLLTYLWENPKMMANLLLHSNTMDIKKVLAPFLANNFYENILSFNYLQENFMYVISLLCKEEVSKLNSADDIKIFLQDTPCGSLLDQLINKIDIKSYFNRILKDIIENIEIKCSDKKMFFKMEILEKQIIDKINSDEQNFKRKKNKNLEDEEKGDVYRKNPTEKCNRNLGELLSFTSSFTDENDNDESLSREKFDKESIKLFMEKYTPELCAKDFKENMNSTDDIRMKNYYQFQLKYCDKQKDYFSNTTFMSKIFESKVSQKLLNEYQLNFMKAILIIKEIFNKLLNDLHLLPYSVKCLCKIILLLIRKKFPDITTTEENAFVAKFFFCKLFAPIFREPSTGALISNFIISRNTIHNLGIISPIILQMVSGRLYREGGGHGEYTPFNWFFLEEMPLILKFFDNLTKVQLPKFIEDFLSDKLPDDYTYKYFKENPEQVIFHRSICFNIYDIKCLLENMNNCKEEIFQNNKNSGLYKTFNKLYNNKKNIIILNDLLNQQDNMLKNSGNESNNSSINYNVSNDKSNILDEKDINLDNPTFNRSISTFFGFGKKQNQKKEIQPPKSPCIIKYYLITDLLINDNYNNIFNPSQKNYHFSIKELKECKNEEDINKNIVIKVKNFFSSLLCNYRQLVKTDFDEGTTYKTIDILRELKSYMKSSDFVIDGSIPSEWYVNSLVEYLKKLPKNLINNEYELLFKDMEDDLNKSIKELDFETLSVCLNKIKFVHKGIVFYENTKKILIDISLNNKVENIVESDSVKVEIKFYYNNDKKKFKIKTFGKKQLQLLDSMVYDELKTRKICNTIKDFCNNFPNLIEYQEKQGIDVFKMQSELQIPEKLEIYFDLIKDFLSKKKKTTDNKSFNLINEKIYDYVMTKIYNKIFPSESDNKDNKIFQNSIKLSWVEPKHFIQGKKNYVYDSFLPDAIRNFDLLYKEKSPRKKIISMSNIFNTISNLVKFNNEGTDNLGVDDQMPILNYSLIKAHPVRIYSICRFLELYIGDLKSKNEGNQLTQLSGICERVIEINNDFLINVSESEFKRKCSESAYGIGLKKEKEKYF